MEEKGNAFKPVAVPLFISLSIGILCARFIPFQIQSAFFTALIIGFLCVCYVAKPRWLIFFSCVFFFFGFYQYDDLKSADQHPHHISTFADTAKVKITGRVVSFVQSNDLRYKAIVQVRSISSDNQSPLEVNGKMILNIYGNKGTIPRIFDWLRFETKLKSIRNFNNPGRFDYEQYMQDQGIYATGYVRSDKLRIIDKERPLALLIHLVQRIESIREEYDQYMKDQGTHKRATAIIVSLVTGKKERIDSDTRDLFSKLGIGHLLAISGLHLSIVSWISYLILYRLFFFLCGFPAFKFKIKILQRFMLSGGIRKLAGFATLLPLICYAGFSGFSPSTQRAFIMTAIFIIVLVFDRESDLLSSLFCAGILILTLDPAALLTISFQFSFTAVFFIFAGLNGFKAKEVPVKNLAIKKVIGFILVTVFAGVGTMPLTAHYFNMVSLVQIFSNLLAIPVIGFMVLPSGFLILLTFKGVPWIAGWLKGFSQFTLDTLLTLLEPVSRIPFTWARVTDFSPLEVAGIYLVLLSLFFWSSYRHTIKPLFMVGVGLGLFALSYGLQVQAKTRHPDYEITVLDVGQGGSSVIRSKNGTVILVDGGGFSSRSGFDTGRFIVAPFLWHHDIKKLDAIILTHPESDHLNGLVFIAENFKVGQFIKNRDSSDSKTYAQLISVCQQNAVKILHPPSFPKTLRVKDLDLSFYTAGDDTNNLNNNSLVFTVKLGNRSVLFCGDILKKREQVLGHSYQGTLRADLMIVPHHGSATSSSQFFLEKVNPESVIIPCGWSNRYGFPHQSVLDRYETIGAKVFRTDLGGAVFARTDGKRFEIKTFKDN